MQNQMFSLSYNSHSLLGQHHETQDMQDHFNTLLGQTSRYTAAQTEVINSGTNEQAFHSSRMFVIGTLQSWGMKMGTLQYSRDNQLTLKCILQLISQKQRDIEYKMKVKEQLGAVNFQKEKYESLLRQSKNALAEKDKQLGKLQNECTELRKKLKVLQNQTKKQKADDQKMIFMLKSKNQQILHQIKKKQAQVTRVKQQMKRNVLSKTSPQNKNQSPLHTNPNTAKNSFELIQKIQRINITKQSKWKKNATQRTMNNNNYAQNFEQQKFTFMVDKYQKEKKLFLNENTLLRGKIFQIREVLMTFAEWMNVELFGQTLQKTRKLLQKKFICNHNLMFSQNALLDDLTEVINQAKHGIQQLQQRLQQTQAFVPSQKSIDSPLKNNKKHSTTNQSSKSINVEGNVMFKKKSVSIRQTNTPSKFSPLNVKSQKTINTGKEPQKEIKLQRKQVERVPQQQSRQSSSKFPSTKSPQIQKSLFASQEYNTMSMPSQIRPSKSSYINELQLSAFQNDILSDIHEHSASEDPDHSIVSHISASEFLKEMDNSKKGKYDKWDILFHTEGDEEEE